MTIRLIADLSGSFFATADAAVKREWFVETRPGDAYFRIAVSTAERCRGKSRITDDRFLIGDAGFTTAAPMPMRRHAT